MKLKAILLGALLACPGLALAQVPNTPNPYSWVESTAAPAVSGTVTGSPRVLPPANLAPFSYFGCRVEQNAAGGGTLYIYDDGQVPGSGVYAASQAIAAVGSIDLSVRVRGTGAAQCYYVNNATNAPTAFKLSSSYTLN